MVEMLNSQDPTSQLNVTKPHVKSLLKGLLVEIRGSKYQILLQITFRIEIENGELKYSPLIYFSSNTQTVINGKILMTVLRLLIN